MRLIFSRNNFVMCLAVFGVAIPVGLLFSLAVPQAAGLYVQFMARRVFSSMGMPAGAPLGLREVFVVLVNNLIPVVAGFSFPPLIVAQNLSYAARKPGKYRRRSVFSELRLNLSLFGLALAFAFGFVVFGVFFGYLLRLGGPALLVRGLTVISIHAPFEVSAILLSASVALGLRDSIQDEQGDPRVMLRAVLWPLVKSRRMALSLILVVVLLVLGAFLEVYVSVPLAAGGLFRKTYA